MPSTTIAAIGIPIDRTIPVILRDHINLEDWTDFCDKYDVISRSMTKIFTTLVCGMFSAFLVGVITIGVSTSITSPASFPIGVPIGVIIIIVSMVSLLVYAYKQNSRAMQEIADLCEEASKKQPSLTFHVRTSVTHGFHHVGDGNHGSSSSVRYHIEVFFVDPITPVSVETRPSTNYEPEIVYATASVDDIVLTPAERLIALENLKPYLTEKEYVQKREDIIAVV